MRGSRKTIGWLSAALLVLLVVYGVMLLLADPLADQIWFDMGRRESIETIHLENPYGTFDFYQEEGVWMLDSDGTYRANDLKMSLMCEALKSFKVTRVLEEELPVYGLEEGAADVSFTTSSGKEYSLRIGATTMNASDCYVKDLTDGRIFVTDGASVAQLTGSAAAYRYKEVFMVDKTQITGIRYWEGGNLQVALQKSEESGWMITEPYDFVPARSIEMDELLTQMRGWSVAGYVDMSKTTPQQLGLGPDSPTLEVTDAMGNTQTLIFGNSSETTTCVQIGEEHEVVLLYNADLDLSVLEADTLLFVAPLKTSMDQIKSIQVSVSTGDYIFKVDENTGMVTCNGQHVDEDAFSGIFFKYISLIADGADPNQVVPPQTAVAYFKTEYRDGTQQEMTAYGRDQGTCYMGLNGETIYYLETEKIVELVQRIEEAVAAP